MNSGQVLAHVKQLTLESCSSFTSLWPSEVTTSAKIKLSVPVYTTNCLFPTALNKETRGTFAPLHVMFFLQNLQCLEGWNSFCSYEMASPSSSFLFCQPLHGFINSGLLILGGVHFSLVLLQEVVIELAKFIVAWSVTSRGLFVLLAVFFIYWCG